MQATRQLEAWVCNQVEIQNGNDQVKENLLLDALLFVGRQNMILLGGDDNGKSKTIQRMEMIRAEEYTLKHQKLYKELVYSCTLQSLKHILLAMDNLQMDFAEQSRREDRYTFLQMADQIYTTSGEIEFGKSLVKLMKRLWKDDNVQICFFRMCFFRMFKFVLPLHDTSHHFLNHLDRIGATDDIPTQEDVLRLL